MYIGLVEWPLLPDKTGSVVLVSVRLIWLYEGRVSQHRGDREKGIGGKNWNHLSSLRFMVLHNSKQE